MSEATTGSPSAAPPGGHRDQVVLGFDGSRMSWLALDWAANWATSEGKGLTLLAAAGSSPRTVNLLRQADRASHLSQRLDRAARHVELRFPHLDVNTVLTQEGPVQALAEASREASLVVTGTRGLGLVGGSVLGSVTDAVLARALGPVAAVPTAARFANGPILLGIDRAATARKATMLAFEHARRRNAPVLALLMEPFAHWQRRPQDHQPGRAGMEAARDALSMALREASSRYPGVAIDSRVMPGRPLPWLLQISRMTSMVVLGTRRHARVPGLLHASVSRRTAQQAHCPAIVVPDPGLGASAPGQVDADSALSQGSP